MLKLCQHCGRDRPPYRRGRCDTCARYWCRYGVEHPLPIIGPGHYDGEPCAGGCGRTLGRELGQARHDARGRCATCYARYQRGSPPRPPRPTCCQVCGIEPWPWPTRYTRGMCHGCYVAWWRQQRREGAA